jgi:hypothetical protein
LTVVSVAFVIVAVVVVAVVFVAAVVLAVVALVVVVGDVVVMDNSAEAAKEWKTMHAKLTHKKQPLIGNIVSYELANLFHLKRWNKKQIISRNPLSLRGEMYRGKTNITCSKRNLKVFPFHD